MELEKIIEYIVQEVIKKINILKPAKICQKLLDY